MTSLEEFLQAFQYVEQLEPWIWHDFRKVPVEISTKVFELIDSNSFSKEWRLGWMVNSDVYFFKSKNCEYKPIKSKNESGSNGTESTE